MAREAGWERLDVARRHLDDGICTESQAARRLHTVGRSCTFYAHAMRMPCPCHAHAMHMPCTCHAHAVHMPCTCRPSTCTKSRPWTAQHHCRSESMREMAQYGTSKAKAAGKGRGEG
eukprot:scaffold35181_cov24-Phaeocystis_antarctica.AAC.2